jgi:hypothetical protein
MCLVPERVGPKIFVYTAPVYVPLDNVNFHLQAISVIYRVRNGTGRDTAWFSPRFLRNIATSFLPFIPLFL